ncbi:MAG: hypothetical protein RLZZ163_772, partial [Actinomycetota bacterium]
MRITLKQAGILVVALALTGAALPVGIASANTGVQVNDCGSLETRPA